MKTTLSSIVNHTAGLPLAMRFSAIRSITFNCLSVSFVLFLFFTGCAVVYGAQVARQKDRSKRELSESWPTAFQNMFHFIRTYNLYGYWWNTMISIMIFIMTETPSKANGIFSRLYVQL